MKLEEFLVKAKKNTYAGNGEGKKPRDCSKELSFKEGTWEYRDKYFGFNPFAGQEVIWKNNKPVWIMNYRGEVFGDSVSAKEIYEFLKKCLGLVKKDFPFRGPKNFKTRDFKYLNSKEGDISDFKGVEKIFFQGEEVYQLNYHGGFIQ